jgi:hypothetical protein
MKLKTYTVIVEAPALNRWEYEVTASSQAGAERKIHNALRGDGELPDPVSFEQGVEVDGELEVVDSYES